MERGWRVPSNDDRFVTTREAEGEAGEMQAVGVVVVQFFRKRKDPWSGKHGA
jgi:hypothetical protein